MGLFLQNTWLSLILTALCAYLLGSINFAILVTRAFSGTDIRSYGSGNAGATNVLRAQGKLPALITFLGDLGKSVLSVFLGGWLMHHIQLAPFTAEIAARMPLLTFDPINLGLIGSHLAGIFCLIGHLFPVFFGFRGGKGVMTSLGMILLLDWRTALILLGIFVITVAISRMVSLGSVLAAASLPAVTALMRALVYGNKWPTVLFCTAVMTVIAVVVVVKHRTNLKRIAAGTENKLSFRKHR